MVKIEVAKHSGFCFGVKRAIDVAKDVAAQNKDTTYVLGQLVHNERVIDELEKQNIVFVDEIKNIPQKATTVLRAHGEPGTTYEQLQARNISQTTSLNDATCPLVTLVHNVAKKLVKQGYDVAIFGKADHPESIGTSYHIKGDNTLILETKESAQQFIDHIRDNDVKKMALISQTTMSVDGFKQLREDIAKQLPFSEIPLSMTDFSHNYGWVDTICNPTKQRQTGTEELAQRADVMIVIGGLNSSNSKELAAKSKSYGIETHYIQDASQIEKQWIENKELIGVTAGASTPQVLIDEVVEKLNGMIE